MKSFSKENTVLIYTNKQKLYDRLAAECNSIDINLYRMQVPTDLFGIPCFIFIVDAELVNENLFNDINEIFEFENEKTWSTIILGNYSFQKEYANKTRFELFYDLSDLSQIKKTIRRKMKVVETELKLESLNHKKIRRVIKLYLDLHISGINIVDIDLFCLEHAVSERTLRRDIKLLKEIFPAFGPFFSRPWNKL
jgi:hypothetical protein